MHLLSGGLALHQFPDRLLLFGGVIEVSQHQNVAAGGVKDYVAELKHALNRVPAVNGRDLLDWPPLFRQGGVTSGTFFSYLLLRIRFSFVEVSDERFASRRPGKTSGPL
jgi:hypothetical protein